VLKRRVGENLPFDWSVGTDKHDLSVRLARPQAFRDGDPGKEMPPGSSSGKPI
jgi:hypothetical protein